MDTLGAQQIFDSAAHVPTVEHIQYAYSQGSIIEFYWSSNNPINDGSAETCSDPSAIQAIMPGGLANAKWKESLDRIGDFFNSLKCVSMPTCCHLRGALVHAC